MRNRRTLCGIVAFCFLLPFPIAAATVVEWNFNSPAEDTDTNSGTLSSSRGNGAFTLVGTTSSFGEVGSGQTSDSAPADNSQLRLRGLPRIDAANKSVGVEFTIVTLGHENLILSWDQYNSRTASRYWRVQYTLDGFVWIDHQSVQNTNASSWVSYRVSFAEIAALHDRPYLSIRLVQEFERTATGAGAEGYAAVDETATYSAAGSWWLDMVSISARVIGATNTPPTVSALPDMTLIEGSSPEPIAFTVADLETAADALQITATSSNPGMLTDLILSGGGSNRSISFQALQSGETDVMLRVSDNDGDFTETKFKVTVLPEPIAPAPNFFVLWSFNGTTPDSDASTGSFEPAGLGTLAVIGTSNHTFGIVAQGRTSDPATNDNSMLRITSFPRQGEGNKTCGIEVRASTIGRRDISLIWDHSNSGTASRYWKIQYSTNGADFVDYARFTNSTASAWLRARTVTFKDVAGTANNPSFAIRLVSEFASDSGYEAVSEGANYSGGGTLWLDMIGLSGESLPDPQEPAPQLQIIRNPEVRLSWPGAARDFFVEAKDDWTGEWIKLANPAEEHDGQLQLTIQPESAMRFFRLRRDSGP